MYLPITLAWLGLSSSSSLEDDVKIGDIESVFIKYKDGTTAIYKDRIVVNHVKTDNLPRGVQAIEPNIEWLEIRINLGEDSRGIHS